MKEKQALRRRALAKAEAGVAAEAAVEEQAERKVVVEHQRQQRQQCHLQSGRVERLRSMRTLTFQLLKLQLTAM